MCTDIAMLEMGGGRRILLEFGLNCAFFSFSAVVRVAVSSWANAKDEDFLILKCSKQTVDESKLMGFSQSFLIFASFGNNLRGGEALPQYCTSSR